MLKLKLSHNQARQGDAKIRRACWQRYAGEV